jgi:hypothetical protein
LERHCFSKEEQCRFFLKGASLTISSVLNRVSYICNGVTTAFAVPFPFQTQSDLVVLETIILTGVQTVRPIVTYYTISGIVDALGHYPNGGTVNAVAAPAATVSWTIYRDPAITQGLDLVENDNLPAESLEASLDYAIMLIQRLADLQGRSLRQPDGDSASIGTLPSKVDRASMFQAYDANGDPIASAGTSANLGPVSAFIDTLLVAANPAAARTTLGITSTSNADDLFRILGSADATKQYALEVDALTTATTRTRFVADEDANSGQTWEVMNLTLVATVAANALTIAVKTKNGTDASVTDPIILKFRHATLGTGTYTTVALTGALSLVVSSGSTLGTASAVAHRLYVGVGNDAGTLRLFVYNPLVSASLSLAGLMDDLVYTSVAEGGAGAADSAHTLYSGTAFTSKAIRVVGYLESTQATAGTWATAPSKIQIVGARSKRTGDVVQTQLNSTGAVATGTTAVPEDDTIPQVNEGDVFMAQTFTPTNAINVLRIHHQGFYSHTTTNGKMVVFLCQDSIANALAVQAENIAGTTHGFDMQLFHRMQAGAVAATTFRIRAGMGAGATTTFNGVSSARVYGGGLSSILSVEEIFV